MPGLLGTSLNTDDILETLRGIGRGLNFGGTSGMIGAPVDMATAVLNNPGLLHPGLLGVQGLGIKDPVGGSKWIEQKLQNQGLLPQRQGNWQEGVGELASTFVNPMTAAAVAGPKLYAAEQRAIENAMAPTTLNKQAGAIVWHGSPHKFDKFDASKIGTGEGAQAYGHGLYLAESPDVAKSYMGAGTSKGGAAFENRLSKMMERAQDAGRYGEAGALEELLVNRNPAMARTKFSVSNGYSPETVSQAHKVIAQFEDKFQPSGLYKVDLPDSAIARMLDWDKPLSQQAPEVQAAVESVMAKRAAESEAQRLALNAQYPNRTTHPILSKIVNKPKTAFDYKGEAAVSQLVQELGGPDKAAAFLRQQGIPGIRYLDGMSRGAGQGSSNFVVFPGNEDLLRILERNGQPVGLLGM